MRHIESDKAQEQGGEEEDAGRVLEIGLDEQVVYPGEMRYPREHRVKRWDGAECPLPSDIRGLMDLLRLVRKDLKLSLDPSRFRVPLALQHEDDALEDAEDGNKYSNSDYKVHRSLLSFCMSPFGIEHFIGDRYPKRLEPVEESRHDTHAPELSLDGAVCIDACLFEREKFL